MRYRAKVLIASGPKPSPCHCERIAISIPACRYMRSSSSKLWISPIASPSSSIRKCDSPSSGWVVSLTALPGSPHQRETPGSLKISMSFGSSPISTGRSMTRFPRSSGGEVDPDRPQALVQRIERELHDLALGVPELGDVGRVGRIKCARDQRQALDDGLLDDRRVAVRVLAHRVLQHLDAE